MIGSESEGACDGIVVLWRVPRSTGRKNRGIVMVFAEHLVRRRPGGAGAIVASIALIATLVPSAAAPVLADTGTNALVPLVQGATTTIAAQPTGSGTVVGAATEIAKTDALERSPKAQVHAAHVLGSPGIPNPVPQSIARFNQNFSGFNGLSHLDSRTASGGNQFSLEPPDQGLCVGNGFVLETINDVLAVYDTHGKVVAGPEALNAFLGYSPAVNRTSGAAGPFVTDPRCLYDPQTNRWFHTVLTFETDPASGAFTGTTHVDIAVSRTGNPTGAWTVFHLNTTDDGTGGTPSHAGCPCLGDQPLIGADSNGFYVTTNEFPVFASGFNGAQVYAMSKWALAAAATGGPAPAVAMINAGSLATPDAGGTWYSIQPATSPAGDNQNGQGGPGGPGGPGSQIGQGNQDGQGRNGTEYFLSALDFFGSADNRVAVWALTNTGSLNRARPNVQLTNLVIGSESYASALEWGVSQKSGPTPLGTSIGEELETLNANDDRMNQVVFASGLLWSGVNTLVGDGNRTGVAYFAVHPSWQRGSLAANMVGQGYVSLASDSVVFPSIAVNGNGDAAMSFTVSGPDFFPSTGYVLVSPGRAGPVHIAGSGAAPEDGFTGYIAYDGNGIARWGDYSAGVADERGNLWVAAEYIPGGTRTTLADWGTFIGRVSP